MFITKRASFTIVIQDREGFVNVKEVRISRMIRFSAPPSAYSENPCALFSAPAQGHAQGPGLLLLARPGFRRKPGRGQDMGRAVSRRLGREAIPPPGISGKLRKT